MDDSGVRIRETTWKRDRDRLKLVRQRVFVEEQGVPEEMEWDRHDSRCHHWLAEIPDTSPVGTVRMTPEGHVGRLSVLAEWRGHGIAHALMQALLERARRDGHRRLQLDAQLHAIGLYEKLGFVVHGQVFFDAGLPHRRMTLDLDPDRG